MNAFLTGSRAYGIPTDESDTDLVVYCDDQKALHVLRQHADNPTEASRASAAEFQPASFSLRYGKLNLIVCTILGRWDAWRRGTVKLLAEAPVTRDRAKEVFKPLFQGD